MSSKLELAHDRMNAAVSKLKPTSIQQLGHPSSINKKKPYKHILVVPQSYQSVNKTLKSQRQVSMPNLVAPVRNHSVLNEVLQAQTMLSQVNSTKSRGSGGLWKQDLHS